ncbi:MAG: hypothetical protein OXU20_03015 [Myxococcales bacterium]|nr:hypothetical protein [Myxococcales bacterium]
MTDRDESDGPTVSSEAGEKTPLRGKSIGDRIRDLIDGVMEALDQVISPPPQPVPIPVRTRYPRRR